MAFQIGEVHAAEQVTISLRGIEVGLGFLRLTIQARYHMWDASPSKAPKTMEITGGEVRASGPRGRRPQILGALSLTSGGPVTQRPHRFEAEWLVALDLPLERVAALERLRAGGDLVLEVQLRGTTSQGAERQFALDTARIELTQSDWAKHLRAAGYRDTLLLEIPLTKLPESDAYEQVAKLLRDAHEHFADGRYRTAVEDCRKVLEALGKVLGDGHGRRADLISALQANQELMKAQRLLGVRYALFHTACLAVHADSEARVKTTWHRHDALMVLTMTIAAVQWAIAEAEEREGV
jgi:hypothetical protein